MQIYVNKLAFKKNSAKANWPGVKAGYFFQVSNKFYPYNSARKIILANLPVLSVLPNTFLQAFKKSKLALAMGTYAEKTMDSPALPFKVFRDGVY